MYRLSPSAILLVGSVACSPVPEEVRQPAPEVPLVRVLTVTPLEEVHRGALIFADADSLVIADRHTDGSLAVRDNPDHLIELYRGQRVTPGGTARTAGKSALLGMVTGLMSAAAGAAVAELLGVDLEADEAIKAGVVIGAASGVAGGITKGASEGDPVWHRVTVLQVRQELCRCAHP